ncbi:MAG: sugar transferase [bacterium]|jgi:exopolysaccharide biosynthesis polyprenyl glycosylphosphotransferase|nr:sugar transferase [bacterium]
MPYAQKQKGAPKGPVFKFILCDLLVSVASLFLAFFIRFRQIPIENFLVYIELFVFILILPLGTLYLFRMYDFSRKYVTFDIIYFTLVAMLTAHAIEFLAILYTGTFYYKPIIANFLLHDGQQDYRISRYIVILNFIISWAGTCGWRVFYLRRRRRWAYDITRILIVGAGELGESVQSDIREYSRLGHAVVGMVDDSIEVPKPGSLILGKIDDLSHLVEQENIDEIIVTSRKANRQELLSILSKCHATNCKVRLLPELYEVTIGEVEIEQVAGIPLITTSPKSFNEVNLFFKRGMDIICSLFALVVLAFILPVIAIAIKSSSHGPVFYKQRRVGLHGVVFSLYKFRTMHVNAESGSGPVLSWNDDPRVHNTGRFLRRWHLDELPQFWNVLKGEMSIVGPRPERPHFAEKYYKKIPAYRMREAVRPGMTGLAQIHGFYSSPVQHKLRYDLAYITAMSVLLDIKIIFLTMRRIFSHQQPV